MKKRMLAITVILALCISMLPLAVFAEGTEAACTHENVRWTFFEEDHWGDCIDCYETIFAHELHVMQDGTCTVCGFTPCPDGQHTYISSSATCQVCQCYHFCYDSNADCKCDECANEWHSYEWEKTETHHADVCVNCGDRIDEEPHKDADGVNGCDRCYYGCPHAELDWFKDADRHEGTCEICGEAIVEWAEHTMVDEKCTVCGYEPCRHENSEIEWEFWLDHHEGMCLDCGDTAVENEPHTMENGTCTVCGFTPCADGQHMYTEYYYKRCSVCKGMHDHISEDGDCYCDVCGAKEVHYFDMEVTETKHKLYCVICGYVGYEGEHFDDDGVGGCDRCHYGCDHKNAYWERYAESHAELCPDCGKYIVEWAEHTMVDDVCTVCGYETCKHEVGVGSWSMFEKFHVGWCEGCGEQLTRDFHTMENGKCTVCGFTPCADGKHVYDNEGDSWCVNCGMEHDHVDRDGDCACDTCLTPWHRVELTTSEAEHIYTCTRCGYEESRAAHYDSDGVGGCDQCNYGCEHKNAEWVFEEELHWKNCYECYSYTMEMDYHTMVDGKCSVCGFAPCPDGKHTYAEDDPHYCTTCHLYATHDYCGCELCGVTDHTLIDGMDETHHWQFCFDCGTTTEKQAHTLNSVGICTECGYGCQHRALYFWYSHEIHYFECGDCAHTYNFGAHVDADDNGVCDECKQKGIHILKKVEEVAATCTAQGVKEHYICEACEKTYSDTEGKNLVTAEALVIPMALHDYQEGVCTVCKGKDPVYVKVENKAENVPQVSVQVPTQELLTEEDKAAIDAGTTVTVALTVENADATVDEDTKAKVEAAVESMNTAITPPAGDGSAAGGEQGGEAPAEQPKSETKVGMYLEIDLTKTVGETEIPITETQEKVQVNVEVPQTLQNSEEDVERSFFVLRFHDGVMDRLEDIDDDPNTVTFETDRFSTYVLMYTDTQKTPTPVTPATGDGTDLLAYTGLMLASLLGMAVIIGKKKYA